jgi:CubicO group peptidase (beta-lactamase class C family)
MTPEDLKPAPVQPNRFAAAYKVLSDAIAARAFPGCAFGILASNQDAHPLKYCDAMGNFTYQADSPRVAPATVYDLASVTKVVATTAATMLLQQRGLLHLDSHLADLLPEFLSGRSPADGAQQVKLRHLLAHSSGLPGYVEFFRTASDSTELLQVCLRLPLESETGTRTEYSDPGFILLGKALETIIREPLPSWVQREIFHPLGMTSTQFCPPPAERIGIPPTEEDHSFRRRIIQGEVQDENAWLLQGAAGHAGLFSNVPDLLTFAGEILNAQLKNFPTGSKANLFHPRTVQLFAERQGPEGSSRALGWDTPSESSSSGHHFSLHSIGHLGFSGCSLWIDLEVGVAVVLLTNRTWPNRESQLIREVRPAFNDAIREAL